MKICAGIAMIVSLMLIADVVEAQSRLGGTGAGQISTDAPTAGMTIHIDPQTGAILEGPAPGSVPMQMSPDLMNALSTSHAGLLEVPSHVPGGGVIVDLQGRFQNPLIGTIDSSGKLKVQHLHRAPGSTDNEDRARQEVSPRPTDR
jgi:hypothetical protein